MKEALTRQHIRRIGIPARRHGEIARIEGDKVEQLRVDLVMGRARRAAMRRAPAKRLRGRAIAPGKRRDPVPDADVAREGVGRLLENGRLAGLPSEAAEHHLLVLDRPYPVGAARNAVAVAIVRILTREDVLDGNGFDETETNHLWCEARRDHRLRMHRTIAEILDAVRRPPQRDHFTTGKRDWHFLIVDDHAAFAEMALNAEFLKLRTVGGLGNDRQAPLGECRALLRRLGWNRKAQEHRNRAVLDVRPTRRLTATVLQMTALARARVEERTKPIRRFGRGRRGHPELAKHRIADLEVHLLREGHVRREVGEGFSRVGPTLRCRVATWMLLAILECGE